MQEEKTDEALPQTAETWQKLKNMKNRDGREINEMPKKLSELNILKLVLKSRQFLDMPFGIHGRSHACRVFVLANALANLVKGNKKIDITAITISSLLHDCGRSNDGKDPRHSVKSAEKAMEFVEDNNISCNKKIIKECIIMHCPPRGCKQDNLSIECKIIGDADKLDRFRFSYQTEPCKKRLLKLRESKYLMDLSARINGHNWRSR